MLQGDRFAIEICVPCDKLPAHLKPQTVACLGCVFPSPSGAVAPEWTVGEFIASGAYGGVYRCHSAAAPHLGDLAVKVVRVPRGSERQLRQLQREIDIGRELQRHPNIVTWLDVVTGPCGYDEVAIVMEYCGGQSLQQFLNARRAPLEEDTARRFFQQLVAALEHCHRDWPHIGPVCHRDLKPENLLLGGEDNMQLKICDFGLGRGDADLREPSQQTAHGRGAETKGVGTIAYMPPEVTRPDGSAYSGCAADVWSAVGLFPPSQTPSLVVLQASVAIYTFRRCGVGRGTVRDGPICPPVRERCDEVRLPHLSCHKCRTPDSDACVSARLLQSGMQGEQADTIRRIQTRALVCGSLPEHLSSSLRELLDALLQVDPAMRPSASAMQQVSCGAVAAEGTLRWLAEAPATPVSLGAELAPSPLPECS